MGALYLASRKNVIGLENDIAASSAVFGISLVLLSSLRILWASLLALSFIGFSMMVCLVSSNIVIQTIVDDSKRGRITALFLMAVLGMAPIGGLFAGALAGRIGSPVTLFTGGLGCVLGSALFMMKLPSFKKAVHPIYAKMGIF